jgi:polyhydroxyalkanoate synthesis regulator phasin
MLTETEKRILKSLHLQGTMGKCGSMSKNKRGKILDNLVKNGYLTIEAELTKKAINELLNGRNQ